MMKIFVFLAIFFASHAALSKAVCGGQTNYEIEHCARSNYESADKDLNQNYNNILSKMPARDKQDLVVTQRLWVVYKEEYCQSAYDAASPGEEAAIDKLTCLTSVTEARTKEIRYLDSSVGMDDFRRSLAIMANLYEHGDTGKVISRLVSQNSDGNDLNWMKYVDLNCRMTASKLSEEHNACVARLNFYRNW
ncbi:lysozyme inhibitor LprI family protein [Paraburkholderia pallida]|uniref:DUF1311 domain-containing protein n=1 Tax=Paraburkholderia pallida TaxID=2547399 RepID=A0A4P7D1C7_9BURK|nr:lysozyme inhibitor LprI family protein [Paraburkholderia pallida]QBR00455.1 DUF1311 domain-containing protein [Paraburkholderia pallida]